jgi:hypothetical protein
LQPQRERRHVRRNDRRARPTGLITWAKLRSNVSRTVDVDQTIAFHGLAGFSNFVTAEYTVAWIGAGAGGT